MMETLATTSGCGPSLDLGIGVEGGGELSPHRRCPVQLDLLPMSSPLNSSSPGASLGSLRTQPHQRLSASTQINSKDPNGAAAPNLEVQSRGNIDMNQLPSSDYDEADTSSSPNSILSPFHSKAHAASTLQPPTLSHHPCKSNQPSTDLVDQAERQDRGGEAAISGGAGSDEEDASMPRKKLRLSKEQSTLLEESFREHSTLNPKQKCALAKGLNLRPRQVEVWFQNRRARTKLKQTEVDCELLKRCCETLTEENRRLQRELQELRAITLPPPPACFITSDQHLFMPLPAPTNLTMCPSCAKLSPSPVDTRRSSILQLSYKPSPPAAPTFHLSPRSASASPHC